MDLQIRGKRALITGAARGIGAAIAESLAREGADLCLAGRNADALAAVAKRLGDQYGVRVDYRAGDLARRQDQQGLHEAFPAVDILVNNAGAIPRGDVLEIDEDRWRESWELKLFGYINLTRSYYRSMVEAGTGVIINIIGLAAEKLDPHYAAGTTANAALVAFTRATGSLSIDRGVRVLGVNPGWVETERAVNALRRRAGDELGNADRWRELVADWPQGRLLLPREIADVVAFLASDLASGVSGHVVTIDGGMGARSYARAT